MNQDELLLDGTSPDAPARIDSALERLSGDVEQILERLVAGIETTISRIESATAEAAPEATDRLRSQASALEAIRAALRSNDPLTLRAVATQLPAIQAAATAACAASLTDAATISGHHAAEIHAEALQHMTMAEIASHYDARSVAALSSEELAVIESRVAQHLEASQQRERATHGEITALAGINGADLSTYNAARARLQVDLARAEASGSLTERARATLLLSTNSLYGGQEAGADAEMQDRLRQQMEEDERALRVALRTEAAREAERRGIPRQDRTAFIEAHEKRELTAVQAEQAQLAEGRPVTAPEAQAAAESILRDRAYAEGANAKPITAPRAEQEVTSDDPSAFAALLAEPAAEIAPPAPTPAGAPPAHATRPR